MPELTKLYYKIKDAAELVGVPQSTLRYWESEFPEVSPKRNAGNIRYYTPEDIETLRIIHYLIRVKGMKLDMAKEQLKFNRKNLSGRLEAISTLKDVREELSQMLSAFAKRK